ncbi:MAG: hypothetical protein ACOYL6_17335 [Bacteriovoracaceae bacterium]
MDNSPEKKNNPAKLLVPALVLLLAVVFAGYKWLTGYSSSGQSEIEIQASEPLNDKLTDQLERQPLVESLRALAEAEERDLALIQGSIKLDDHEKQYANSPHEQIQVNESEAQTKAQEYFNLHQNFLGILGKCSAEGKVVHFVNSAGEIIKHISAEENLSSAQEKKALTLLNAVKEKDIWVYLFSDHLEVVNIKGELLSSILIDD